MATIIDSVDDHNVARIDSYFELQPGCHVVKTGNRVMIGGRRGGRTYPIAARTFALRTQKGFEYTIVLEYGQQIGSPPLIYAVESNARGMKTQSTQPMWNPDEVARCRAGPIPSS